PETAKKANPNYGISVSPEDLASKVLKAHGIPAAAATYKQKHLNLMVNASAPCLSVDGWRKGQHAWQPSDLEHETCFVGIDLASKIDLCAMSFVFPPTAGRPEWRVLQHLWTPEDTLKERAHKDRAPYDIWEQQGWLQTTPGTRIDHGVIRETLVDARNHYHIELIGFDPWHADKLIDELVHDDGFAEDQVLAVPQTFQGMSSASLRLQADILAGLVDARGCPVTAWSVSNTVDQRDGKDNLQFVKKKSRGRIDPVISMTIGIALWLRQPAVVEPKYQSFFVGGARP
ncbi:MAG: terminase large subunit, partial [Actinomycetota bacterium]|nr:terminase large subunit [Actinomycetota bacterium]